MIGTIRKHSTWLWGIIIVITVGSFVWWGGATGQKGGGSRDNGPENYGIILGEPVTKTAFIEAAREATLSYLFKTGEWPGSSERSRNFDGNREAYLRLFMNRKAQQLHIHVPMESVGLVANENMRALAGGKPVQLTEFAKAILAPRGLTMTDFENYLRNEIAIQQMVAISSLPGRLVTSAEVKSIYQRENEELSTQAAFFIGTNYPAADPTPEELGQFYTNYMANYRIPERLQVQYVKWNASNYVEQATKEFEANTNLQAIIDEQYERLGSNYFSEAKSPEEAKGKLRELMFRGQLFALARKDAVAFSKAVFDVETIRLTNFNAAAAARGLAVEMSPPFSEAEPPAALKVGQDFIREAFRLNDQEPFAGPINGEDAVYFIALGNRLPSEMPSLEQIRDRVLADKKHYDAVMAARNAGITFAAGLSNALASGKTFSAACTEAKVTPHLMPAVSIRSSTAPQIEAFVNLMQYKQAAFTTPLGQTSQFIPTSEGGFVVFVQGKLPLDQAKQEKELPSYLNSIRQQRQNEVINSWLLTEAQRDPGMRMILEQLNRSASQQTVGTAPKS